MDIKDEVKEAIELGITVNHLLFEFEIYPIYVELLIHKKWDNGWACRFHRVFGDGEMNADEIERLLKSFEEKYPLLTNKIKSILQKREEETNDSAKKRMSMCRCSFPFSCLYIPCEKLECNCDELNNGYPVRGY